ncbi:MAG: undecaprenyl/decaprenyl-phosphate alpha-N-acetylglucosaminyl 1-phosphate transferase [Chloroflexi bacterium]|nr:undecaprenyl/decaprenyl-phosphate alpha-N-acetylglucosaminyl 1-phosphate transferase [Chloroflexota bacterium]MCL5274925.1 undecaprenyl/decaprenyl-phosphate alpha-N-acetylglucosaminyl 1-phosphate transferase [Chloroflexota bacterium]
MPFIPAAGTLIIAFALSFALTRIAIWLGPRVGIVAVPGGRRKHTRITSRLGALPLWGAFTAAALLSQLFQVPTLDPNEPHRLLGLLLGGTFIFAIGLLDDKFELASLPQFVAQVVAALIAIAFTIFIERFTNPLTGLEVKLPGALVVAVSLLWFMGMINTVNFLDGVDGLAASVAAVAATVTTIHMLREGQYSVALLPIALVGTLLGFLVFNFPQARIFLGGGALFLGYTLACLGIVAGAKVALLLLVMGLPIADVAWQIFDRARHGRNPTRGDRGHLHFRLADGGWSARRIIFLYAGTSAAFGAVALISQPPLFKLITLAVLALAVITTLFILSNRHSEATLEEPDPTRV